MVLVTAVTLSGYEREKETRRGAVSRLVNSRRVEVSQLCLSRSYFLSLSLSSSLSPLLLAPVCGLSGDLSLSLFLLSFLSFSLSLFLLALTFVGEYAYVICLLLVCIHVCMYLSSARPRSLLRSLSILSRVVSFISSKSVNSIHGAAVFFRHAYPSRRAPTRKTTLRETLVVSSLDHLFIFLLFTFLFF